MVTVLDLHFNVKFDGEYDGDGPEPCPGPLFPMG